jgi:hypothetical protein
MWMLAVSMVIRWCVAHHARLFLDLAGSRVDVRLSAYIMGGADLRLKTARWAGSFASTCVRSETIATSSPSPMTAFIDLPFAHFLVSSADFLAALPILFGMLLLVAFALTITTSANCRPPTARAHAQRRLVGRADNQALGAEV